MATSAELLLLDEPLAGLADVDRERIGALIRRLSGHYTILLIEHDIDRVISLSDRITVLHQGRLIADGDPDAVVSNAEVVKAYLGEASEERSEEHTSELQSLMRISYAVFCLKKKQKK